MIVKAELYEAVKLTIPVYNGTTDSVAFVPTPILFIVVVVGLYSIGCSAADMDRRAQIAGAELTLWGKRLLFLGQPNPFRCKTIIFQKLLVITSPVVLVVGLVLPYPFNSFVMHGHIIIMFILTWTYDVRWRRKLKD